MWRLVLRGLAVNLLVWSSILKGSWCTSSRYSRTSSSNTSAFLLRILLIFSSFLWMMLTGVSPVLFLSWSTSSLEKSLKSGQYWMRKGQDTYWGVQHDSNALKVVSHSSVVYWSVPSFVLRIELQLSVASQHAENFAFPIKSCSMGSSLLVVATDFAVSL